MILTETVANIVDGLNFEDDVKQDFYVKWLEKEGTPPEDVKHLQAYITIMIHNLKSNAGWMANNRARLLEENANDVRKQLGVDGEEADPMLVLIAAEEVEGKLKLLSPLLRATLSRIVLEGWTVCGVALTEGVSENVIYQRIHQARKVIEGDNNE